MKKNMGSVDRTVRIVAALVVAALLVMHKVTGVLAIVLGVFAVAFVVTSFVGWCPAYLPFKLSTLRKGKGGAAPAA
jgi:hypothetical protein